MGLGVTGRLGGTGVGREIGRVQHPGLGWDVDGWMGLRMRIILARAWRFWPIHDDHGDGHTSRHDHGHDDDRIDLFHGRNLS